MSSRMCQCKFSNGNQHDKTHSIFILLKVDLRRYWFVRDWEWNASKSCWLVGFSIADMACLAVLFEYIALQMWVSRTRKIGCIPGTPNVKITGFIVTLMDTRGFKSQMLNSKSNQTTLETDKWAKHSNFTIGVAANGGHIVSHPMKSTLIIWVKPNMRLVCKSIETIIIKTLHWWAIHFQLNPHRHTFDSALLQGFAILIGLWLLKFTKPQRVDRVMKLLSPNKSVDWSFNDWKKNYFWLVGVI